VGSKPPLIDLPLLGRLTSTIGFFSADKTNLNYFLVIFGLFLVPLLAFVFSQRGPQQGVLGIAAHTRPAWDVGVVSIIAAFALGFVVGFPLLTLLPLGLYAAYMALRAVAMQHSIGVGFALWLAAIGCFVCFGTELIYIRDTFEGWQPRFNTIFKFYYQTWLIWGALSGYALWWLLRGGRRAVIAGAVVLTTLLLLGGLVYPALTAGRMASQKEWRGLAGVTPRESSPAGQAAIAWLRANAAHNAVVLEGVGGAYNPEGYGGVSASTGLPTVLGWPSHQEQWRGGDAAALAQIRPREADVQTIYAATDPAQARELLALYNVAYVYWSDLERQAYGSAGEAKFAALGDVAFQEDSVTIYRIR
jgi:YYY domain-containing protein